VVNVRGELRACVSLARLLGLHAAPQPSDARLERLLVLRQDEHCVAMPVDEVHGVQRYHPHQLQDKPATLALTKASHIKALLPWQERSIGLLDEMPLFHSIDRSLASASAT
jgi:chemotaxis-related protein WspD